MAGSLGLGYNTEATKQNQYNPYLEAMFKALNPLFGQALRGQESPQTGLLNQYYQQSLQNLGGRQTRSLNQAGQGAGAMAYARGLNPYNFVQHSQADVYDSFAPQYGELLSSLMKSKYGANQDYLSMLSNMLMQSAGGARQISNSSTSGGGIGINL